MARLVMERRFALYSDAAPIIIEIEEGLRAGDIRILERVGELDRILRSSLAFLTPAVSDALGRLRDSTKDALVGGRFDEDEVIQNISDLHLAMGQLLHDNILHEMTKILRLPTAQPATSGLDLVEAPPAEPVPGEFKPPSAVPVTPPAKREKPPSARTKTTLIEAPPPNEIKAWKHQKKAQEFYEQENYKKAVKQYYRAIKLLPGQPSFHNDLGLALRKVGRTSDAIAEYRLAIDLANRYPDKRGEEWFNAYFNLGNALRAMADEELAQKNVDVALDAHRDSITAYIEFLNHDARSPNAAYAQKMVRNNQGDIRELERWMRIIRGGRPAKIDFGSIKKKLAEEREKAEAEADKSEKKEPGHGEESKKDSEIPGAKLEGPVDDAGPIPVAEAVKPPEAEPEVKIGDTDSARLKAIGAESESEPAAEKETKDKNPDPGPEEKHS
jgi:tetratricopeptide (TPR) repeat protein